jgi:hypothetical protein
MKINDRNALKGTLKRVAPGAVNTEVAQNRRGEVLQETLQWRVRMIPAFASCCPIAG